MLANVNDPAVASSGGAIEEADIAAAEALGRYRDHPAIRVIGALSEAADQAPSFAICGAVLAAGLVARRPVMAEAGARMLASAAVATALKAVVKNLVSRTRPNLLLNEGRYDLEVLGPGGGERHSFPSGHTAGAVAIARGLARACPDARAPAYAVAAAIALVQAPRAKHYPLDIAAGALIGVGAELLVEIAADRMAGTAQRKTIRAITRRIGRKIVELGDEPVEVARFAHDGC